MCRSEEETGVKGGIRCDCDSSEKRRLRRHNATAMENVLSMPSSPRPAAPNPFSPPVTPVTMEDIKEAVNEAQEARRVYWDELGAMTKNKNSPEYKNAMVQLEEKITYSGQVISNMVDQNLGTTAADLHAMELVQIARLQSRYNQLQPIYESGIKQLNDLHEEYRVSYSKESKARLIEKETKIREQLLPVAKERHELSGNMMADGEIVRNLLKARIFETLRILGEIREMGGEIKIHSGNPNAVEALLSVAHVFPKDWINNANRQPLLVVGMKESADAGESAVLGSYLPKTSFSYKNKLNQTCGANLKWYHMATTVSRLSFTDRVSETQELEGNYYFKPEVKKELLKDTAVHEFAHRIENTQGGLMAATQKEFLRRRTMVNGKEGVLQVLSTVTRGEAIMGYKDHFTDDYMGRSYPSGVFEILSTGAETVFMGSRGGLAGLGGNIADEDMRNFIIGMWASV